MPAEPETTATPSLPGVAGLHRLWKHVAGVLVDAFAAISRQTALVLGVLLAIDLVTSLYESQRTPLSHDELFTYIISQAGSLHQMMYQLRTIDLNPPLSYLLTRASFHLFGVGTLQCRLPEIVAFMVCLASLFFFVRRHVGTGFAAFAVALMIQGDSGRLSVDARPYSLMMSFIAMSLLAWQLARDAERNKRGVIAYDGLLFVALSLLLLSHVFGLLGWFAIAFAELIDVLQKRRLNVGRALAFLLPLGFTWFYIPLVQDHGTSAFPAAFQPTWGELPHFYMEQLSRPSVVTILSALVLVLLGYGRWLAGSDRFALDLPEWIAVLILAALPGILIVRLKLQHAAFFERYGICEALALAILFALFFAWWSGSRPAAGVIATIVVCVLSVRIANGLSGAMHVDLLRHAEPHPTLFSTQPLPDPSLPLVDSSGLTFVEMNFREPASLLANTYYLTGARFAIQYAHATIFEGMEMEKEMFHLRGNVEPYQEFVSQHHQFYVLGTYDYPEDWLLRKLHADGASLRLVDERYTNYKDKDLYEVTMPATTAQAMPASSCP